MTSQEKITLSETNSANTTSTITTITPTADTNNTTITADSIANTYSKQQVITLNTQSDLLKVPYSSLVKHNHFTGAYYDYLVNDVLKRLEKIGITEISLTQQLFKPDVKTLEFRVIASTQFGENVKITGSTDYLGNWKEFEDFTYRDGYWVFVISHDSKDSPFHGYCSFSGSDGSKVGVCKENRENKGNKGNNESKHDTNNKDPYFSGNDSDNIISSNNSSSNNNSSKSDNIVFEYKLVIKGDTGVQWEQTANRSFNLKEIKESIEVHVLKQNNSNSRNNSKANSNSTQINIKENTEKRGSLTSNNHSSNSNNNSNSNDEDIIRIDITTNYYIEYHVMSKLLVLYLKFNIL